MRAFDRDRRKAHKQDVKNYRKALGDVYREALRSTLNTEREAPDRLLIAADIAAASSFMGVKTGYREGRGLVHKPRGLVSRYRIIRAERINWELDELFILRRKGASMGRACNAYSRKYLH